MEERSTISVPLVRVEGDARAGVLELRRGGVHEEIVRLVAALVGVAVGCLRVARAVGGLELPVVPGLVPSGDRHVEEVGDAGPGAALTPTAVAGRTLVVADVAERLAGAEQHLDVAGRAAIYGAGLAREEVVVIAVDGASVGVAAGVVELTVVRETGVGVGHGEAELDCLGAEEVAVVREDLGELRTFGVDLERDAAGDARDRDGERVAVARRNQAGHLWNVNRVNGRAGVSITKRDAVTGACLALGAGAHDPEDGTLGTCRDLRGGCVIVGVVVQDRPCTSGRSGCS